jgi:uncharacterized protein (DUF58 family)
MMTPSTRLLVLAGCIAVPLMTIAALAPAWAAPCTAVLAVWAVLVAVDGIRGLERTRKLGVRPPQILRLTKDVPASLAIRLVNPTKMTLRIRVAAVMPEGVTSSTQLQDIAAPPGDSSIDWPCTGAARGDHPLGAVHLETPSPFGLWSARAVCQSNCTLRVYPNLRDRSTAALFLRNANIGLRMRRQVGKGREFDNLRYYMPGDSFEDIHWKATSRRAFPVVKLYRVEHAQEVYAIVDSSRLSAREGVLESYVTAALHLALVAERQGDRFGLVTFSDRTHRFVRARNGMDHFRLCRETIYNLGAQRVSPDFRDVFTSLQLNLRRRALLVFFTSLDDALLAETFEREIPLLARRHLVRVIVTQTPGYQPLFTGNPPADMDTLYRGLAGQMLSNRMRELTIALQNRGVKLSIADPSRINQKAAAEYLEVKRRQVL